MNFEQLAQNLGLEEDEYHELIELFLETGSADLHQIEAALAGNDLEQVIRSAHTIKGAAGNLGLMDISGHARTIEESAGANKREEIHQGMQTLKTLFEALAAFARN